MPGYIHQPGQDRGGEPIGNPHLRGGVAAHPTGLGQTTAIGIGGDPVNGTNFLDALGLFNDDPATEGVLMIGEIGGTAEEDAAEFVENIDDQASGGVHRRDHGAPGKRMGHAGAIISGGKGTAADKIAAMSAAGIVMAETPSDMGEAMARAVG